jgi:hypothetical protein
VSTIGEPSKSASEQMAIMANNAFLSMHQTRRCVAVKAMERTAKEGSQIHERTQQARPAAGGATRATRALARDRGPLVWKLSCSSEARSSLDRVRCGRSRMKSAAATILTRIIFRLTSAPNRSIFTARARPNQKETLAPSWMLRGALPCPVNRPN